MNTDKKNELIINIKATIDQLTNAKNSLLTTLKQLENENTNTQQQQLNNKHE